MKISIVTLFPESLQPILNSSILGRAQKKGAVEFELVNLRQFGEGVHQIVDGRPYGGGAGMVLRADILAKALHSISAKSKKSKIILTSAGGRTFTQKKTRELSQLDHLIIICGHYEGVDERFIKKYVDEEVSIGDYVLTGGELPALVIIDSITRLLPGVLKKEEATIQESFENGLLEYPQYTRPGAFEGLKVPDVLISGNHKQIEEWRMDQSIKRTREKRPDLLEHKRSTGKD